MKLFLKHLKGLHSLLQTFTAYTDDKINTGQTTTNTTAGLASLDETPVSY